MNKKINELVIDLSKHGGPVYAGRPKGKGTRDKYDLDSADKQNISIKIIVPEKTYTINSSFFLGLLGASIRCAGTREGFYDKFKIEAPDRFLVKFDEYVSRALHEKQPILKD